MQLCINIKDNHFGKNEMFFDVHVEMAFALASIIQFNIWTLSKSLKIYFFAYTWLEIMGKYIYSQCKVARLL